MSQSYTDDCFAGNHVAQTDLQNMENNFAALKSNFSGAAAPPNPVEGMWWADSDDDILKIYDGTQWVNVFNWSTGQFYIGAGYVTALMISDSARKPSLVAGETIAPSIVNASTSISAPAMTIDSMETAQFSPGNFIIAFDNASWQNIPGWTKRIEIKVGRSGTIAMRLGISAADILSGGRIYARIYINGVATGASHNVLGPNGWSYWTENIAVTKGDLVQVYGYNYWDMAHPGQAYLWLLVDNPTEASLSYLY